MIFSRLKLLLYTFIVIPHLIAYSLSKFKKKIDMDVEMWILLQKGNIDSNKYISLYKLLVLSIEFRNVFYMRIDRRVAIMLKVLLQPLKSLHIEVDCRKCGGGFVVQHGNSTIILANSIGDNFWVNQNVTVGWTEYGCPTIGNNVRIGTGAVVLGLIIIGDNVNIGAGAIVVKDVPSNCTVVSPQAYIVKKDGIKVNLKL